MLVVGAALVALLATRPQQTATEVDTPLVGQVAPTISGVTLSGGSFDLSALRGRWVVVNFFASWCPPCQQEQPELVAFAYAHRSPGDAALVGVVFDDSASQRPRLHAVHGCDLAGGGRSRRPGRPRLRRTRAARDVHRVARRHGGGALRRPHDQRLSRLLAGTGPGGSARESAHGSPVPGLDAMGGPGRRGRRGVGPRGVAPRSSCHRDATGQRHRRPACAARVATASRCSTPRRRRRWRSARR